MSEYPKKLLHPEGGEAFAKTAEDEATLAGYGWKAANEPSAQDLDAVASEQAIAAKTRRGKRG